MSIRSKSFGDSEVLHLLYGQIADEIQLAATAGREADFSSLLDSNPQLRDQLERMIPTIQLVCRVGENASTSDDSSQVNRLPERQEFGDYRIIREIGRGGMGIVYEARQLSLDRTIALKVLPMAAFLDDRQLRRFKNETRAAASLQHPSIVTVHGVGCERSVHFYAMDFINGSDLAEVIREIHQPHVQTKNNVSGIGPRPSKRVDDTVPIAQLSTQHSGAKHDFYRSVAKIGIQAAEALQYAHDEGIIHRDVKPANFLLDRRGNVHITDFGLAQVQAQDKLTLTGDLVGTMRYMSPEQIEGEGLVDARTDIYSLGLTLYELISGERAYAATAKAALLREIADTSPQSLRKLLPDLPRDLATIIEKAIAKDADDRYRTARELADDLQAFLNVKPIKAKPSTQWDRIRRFAIRNPAFSAAFAGMMASVSLLAVVSLLLAFTFAKQAKTEATQLAAAKVAERLQRIKLYAADMRNAGKLAQDRKLIELQETLLKWVPEQGSEDFRGFEWFHLWHYCDNSALVRAFDHELPMSQVEFIDDDRILTTGFSKRAKIWSLVGDSSSPEAFLHLPGTFVDGLTYDMNSQRCVAGDGKGYVRIWDLSRHPDNSHPYRIIEHQSQHSIRAKGGDTNDVWITRWNADRSHLAVSGGCWDRGFVCVWKGEEREPAVQLDTDTHIAIDFDANDDLVVAHLRENQVDIYDKSTWQKKDVVAIHADGVEAMRFSDDKQLIAIATRRVHGAKHKTYRFELRHGSDWKPFWSIDLPSRPRGIDFSDDASQVAWGDEDGTVRLVHIDRQEERVDLILAEKMHSLRICDVAISPDETRLATASTDGFTNVWDVKELSSGRQMTIDYPESEFVAYGCHVEDISSGEVFMGYRDIGFARWDTKQHDLHTIIPIQNRGENALFVATANHGMFAVGFGTYPEPDDENAVSRVLFWNANSGESEEIRVPVLGRCISSTSITPDGQWYAAATHHQGVVVVDRQTGQQTLLDLPSKSLAFSHDGETLVVGGNDGIARFLPKPFTQVISSVQLDGRVIDSISFNPAQDIVAAVGFDRQVVIYDRTTGEILRSGQHLAAFPFLVQFSPEGSRIMTASLDGMLRLWTTETLDEVQSWKRKPGSWSSGTFSPDGNAFAISGVDFASVFYAKRTTSLRRLSKSQLRSQACQVISRIGW